MALWTPAEITTALWLDAAASGTITLDGSSNVEQWDDKSGNARHAAQSTSSDRPSYSNTINSVSAITFTGGDRLEVSSFESGTYTWFFASKSSAYTYISLCGSSADSYMPIAQDGSSDTEILRINGAANPAGAETLFDGETSQSVTTRDDCNTALVAASGVLSVVKDIPVMTGTIYIGIGGSSTFRTNGEIGEIVVVSGDPSLSTRQQIEGYLAHKWGLEANLPAGHPYKSSPPYVFTCSGYTSVNGTRASGIPVRLYRRDTGALIGETTSAGVSGTFSIESDYNDYHYAVAIHSTSSGTNALVYDWLKPGE